MRISLLILISTLLLSSCKNKETKVATEQIDSTYLKLYPKIIPKLNQTVTTSNGNYYRFLLSSKEKCRIEWGNSDVNNISHEEHWFLTCEKAKIESENEDFIILNATVTPQLSLFICLPLKQDKKDISILEPIIMNSKTNTVVSAGFRSDTILLITRLNSGQVQPVIDSIDLCHPMFHNCIDSISLTETELYYKYRTDFDKKMNKKILEKRVELKI